MRFEPAASLRRPRCPHLAVAALSLGLASAATAQCTQTWSAHGAPDFNGTVVVRAMTTWDPDGAGPQPEVLVVGGSFGTQQIGTALAYCLATYERTTDTWSTFGPGLLPSGDVEALAAAPNGDLYIGGPTVVVGTIGHKVLRWSNGQWSSLGTGVNGPVHALAVMPNGDVVVGGEFTLAGGIAVNKIARWNGVVWSNMGGGVTAAAPGAMINALAVMPNGDVVAGGVFDTAGGLAAANVARWNGTSWFPLGSGLNNRVVSLRARQNGELLVGGWFSIAGGAAAVGVARWNGSGWLPMSLGVASYVVASVAQLANGEVIVTGEDVYGPVSGVLRWNGTAWVAYGDPLPEGKVYCAAMLPNGEVAIGGSFGPWLPVHCSVAFGTDGRWRPAATGAFPISAIAVRPDGDSYVLGGSSAYGISDGTWTGFLGVPGVHHSADAIAIRSNGDFVLGGIVVTTTSGFPFPITWSTSYVTIYAANVPTTFTLGGSMIGGSSSIGAVLCMPNGDVLAGGSNLNAVGGGPLARWDGSQWAPLAGTGLTRVDALALLPTGNVVAAGPGSLVQWNGAVWSSIGPVSGNVLSLASLSNGDLLAGGSFTTVGGIAANRVARWNGTTWSALGSGVPWEVRAIATLPNGDVAVATNDPSAPGNARVSRWDGTAWTHGPVVTGSMYALGFLEHGELVVGGYLTALGASPTYNLVSASTTCPAFTTAEGATCVGSAGPNVLAALAPPWLGSTFEAQSTGMPAISLALGVFGLSPVSVPLASILPQGAAGCDLLASPDLLTTHVPTAGTVLTSLAIPAVPAIVGVDVRHQVIALEFDAGANLVALTGTNRLTLHLGSFW